MQKYMREQKLSSLSPFPLISTGDGASDGAASTAFITAGDAPPPPATLCHLSSPVDVSLSRREEVLSLDSSSSSSSTVSPKQTICHHAFMVWKDV